MTYRPTAYLTRSAYPGRSTDPTGLCIVAASDLLRGGARDAVRFHPHHGPAVRVEGDIDVLRHALFGKLKSRPDTLRALADAKARLADALEQRDALRGLRSADISAEVLA